ncbi:MAG: hypothetical protein ACM3SY_07395 [Candidatus Omnitrophota bacterium]
MNIKIKTTLIILSIFIIGMVTGIMVTRAFIGYQMKKILSMRAPRGFTEHLERIIEPTETQRDQVRKVLTKYGAAFFAIDEKMRKELLSLKVAMGKELDAILTPEQKERLEQRFMRPRPGPGPRGFFKGMGPKRFGPGRHHSFFDPDAPPPPPPDEPGNDEPKIH